MCIRDSPIDAPRAELGGLLDGLRHTEPARVAVAAHEVDNRLRPAQVPGWRRAVQRVELGPGILPRQGNLELRDRVGPRSHGCTACPAALAISGSNHSRSIDITPSLVLIHCRYTQRPGMASPTRVRSTGASTQSSSMPLGVSTRAMSRWPSVSRNKAASSSEAR